MRIINLIKVTVLFVSALLLTACQTPKLVDLKQTPRVLFGSLKTSIITNNISDVATAAERPSSLSDILEGSLAKKNEGSTFVSSVKFALDTDPLLISKRREVEAKSAAVGSSQARKDFQVATTLYGGIEDVTDNTKGIAVSVNASRLVFDGGRLNSQINAAQFDAEAARMDLLASVDKRAYELCILWLELDKYKTLQSQINRRLAVLDPLIDQLEQVAKAGIGDVSKVTAAQRTVSAIRVEQTNISEGLVRAELEFANAYGSISPNISYGYKFISDLVPKKIDRKLIQSSPLLRSKYALYQSSVANVKSLRAKKGFDVGFEVSAMRPFAGSGYDSDESIGIVGRKTLYNGGLLDSEIQEAEALVQLGDAKIKATYRDGARAVETARQNIRSMDKAIQMARENAKLTADEIIYLRQQLVIGGSTLDSVLSAEARLYEADSKEVKYTAEKHKSELTIVSSLGLLSRALDYKF